MARDREHMMSEAPEPSASEVPEVPEAVEPEVPAHDPIDAAFEAHHTASSPTLSAEEPLAVSPTGLLYEVATGSSQG